MTVQGETVETSFGLADIAVESFELYANATLEATVHPPPAPSAEHRALMDRLAALAAGAYRRVVQGDPSFLRYFQVATPEQELGRLNIGSRPARRRAAGADIGSLRAIPWIFAWTQTRLHLPAWLGAGEALTTLFEEGAEAQVLALAREWPFFRSLLDLLEMVMAKADVDIAAYYDRVLVSDDLRPLGQELRASCRRTTAAILTREGGDDAADRRARPAPHDRAAQPLRGSAEPAAGRVAAPCTRRRGSPAARRPAGHRERHRGRHAQHRVAARIASGVVTPREGARLA